MRVFYFIFVLVVFCAGASASHAEDTWKVFTSDSNLFKVSLPGEVTEKIIPFRISFDEMLQDVEVSAQSADGSTIYRVTAEQSFGPYFSNEYKNTLIQQELDRIRAAYQTENSKIYASGFIEYDKEYAGDLHMSFYDPELKEHSGLRALVVVTKNSRFVQMAIGPEKDMFSLEMKDYFRSLDIRNIGKLKSDDEKEWVSLTSPFDLFELQVPPVVPPYVTSSPTVQSGRKTEVISQAFTDPVVRQSVYYKVYGYRFDANLTTENVQIVMAQKHIQKHGRNPQEMKFEQSFARDIPTLETSYKIRGPEGYEYVDTVRLRAMYLDNTMVVQEMMGPEFLMQSTFMDNTYDLIDFFPQKALKQQTIERLEERMRQQTR